MIITMKNLYLTIFAFLLFLGTQAQIDRTKQPESGPTPRINLGKPNTFELKNGLKVMVVENNKLPRVSGALILDNKPVLEGDKIGIDQITAGMLGNGTTTIPRDAFNEEIDYLGASLFVSVNSTRFNSLSKYFPRVIELMADATQNPLLTQEEFDKQQTQMIEGIKSGENDVSQIASRVQRALAYGMDHHMGEFATEESVQELSLDDVKNYYKTYFKPNNAYLIIVGDVKVDEVKKYVNKYFKDWKKGEIPAYNIPEIKNPAQTEIDFVDMPNAVQSNIALINMIDLKMGNPDYFPMLLANKIYGGGAEGRLFLNLREDKGYTYGAYSSVGTNERTASMIRSFATVRNNVTDSAVVEFVKEIELLRNTKVKPEELEVAKASYVGDFVMAVEDPSTVSDYAFNIATKNLPSTFYEQYLEKINAVTADDIERVAKKYFTEKNARIVVVGKALDVLPNLEKLPYPINYYDKLGRKTEKPELSKPIPPGVTKESVLNNYFKAIGGKDKVESAKSVLVTYEAQAMGNTISTTEKRTPTKYVNETSMGGNVVMKVLMTDNGVTMNKQPLPPALANDMKSGLGTFTELSLLKNDEAELTGMESVDGNESYVITSKGETTSTSYYFDAKTGLKTKEVQVVSMGGNTQNQEAGYSDYKEFNGIMFPTKKTGKLGPQTVEFTLTDAKINEGVSDAEFE